MARSISALARTVSLISHDVEALCEALSLDFASDFGHFARSNNRDRLEAAIGSLQKAKPLHAAILAAIDAGIKAGGLVQGYIGARTGAYDKQPSANVEAFEFAMIEAGEAFTASLRSAPALQPKTPKTKEEKEKAKDEKAQKALDAGEALITAKIQAGELVRAVDVKQLGDFHTSALFDALVSGCSADYLLLGSYAEKLLSLATAAAAAAQKAAEIEATAAAQKAAEAAEIEASAAAQKAAASAAATKSKKQKATI